MQHNDLSIGDTVAVLVAATTLSSFLADPVASLLVAWRRLEAALLSCLREGCWSSIENLRRRLLLVGKMAAYLMSWSKQPLPQRVVYVGG